MLAEMGADVIKIENPKGDEQRAFGNFANTIATDEENPCYLVENAGKRNICLNLKSPEGKEVFFDLLKDANIFFTNIRMPALRRLGISYDDLKDRFPHLIYGHLSGYGLNGPDADLPGFDSTAYFSRVGAMVDNAYKDMGPMGTVYGVGDNTTGTVLCSGLLAALYRQQRTGKGEFVVTSLFGTAVGIFGLDLVSTQDGEGYNEVYPKDWMTPPTPVCTTYMCPGGAITLGMLTHEKFWPGFCRAIGHEEMAEDPRYTTRDEISKPENLKVLVPMFKEIFAQHDVDYWAARLSAENIPYGTARHFKDTHNDPMAWDNGYFNKFTFKNGHTANIPAVPVQFGGFGPKGVAKAADKGENTDEILGELGYDSTRIRGLKENGVVIQA